MSKILKSFLTILFLFSFECHSKDDNIHDIDDPKNIKEFQETIRKIETEYMGSLPYNEKMVSMYHSFKIKILNIRVNVLEHKLEMLTEKLNRLEEKHNSSTNKLDSKK